MACFLAPTTEAIVVSVVRGFVKRGETKKALSLKSDPKAMKFLLQEGKVPWSRKLGWLNMMLWGGSFLLCIEHIWHGEVVPWWPFLTAMKNPDDTSAMLHEILTTGVTMACLVTAVWGVMILAYWLLAERKVGKKPSATTGAR
jgi:hypothetical protein